MGGKLIDTKNIKRYDNPPSGGSCKGHDPKIWYPSAARTNDGTYARRQREAKQTMRTAKNICSTCPVLEQCIGYALHYESHGIWGGTTEAERDKLRRELKVKLIVRETPLFVHTEKIHTQYE